MKIITRHRVSYGEGQCLTFKTCMGATDFIVELVTKQGNARNILHEQVNFKAVTS